MYRVLVCDDDISILESIKIFLKNEGYEVLTAVDGVEALEIIENNECYNLKNLDISGDDLVKIGVQKGRQLGQILDTLLFEVINQNIHNDKETLLKFAKQNLIKE